MLRPLASSRPHAGRLFSAAASAPPGSPAKPQGPTLVSASGAPIASAGSSGEPAGAEVTLTAQNAQQVLQNPGAVLLQVGDLDSAAAKKVLRLRQAAQGRLPIARLDCAALPQICQALQIKSSPSLLLMARGQVAAALEGDLSPAAATGFVERVAQMLGLKVELAEDITELLAEAEEVEWSEPVSAEEAFSRVFEAGDLTLDARVRASVGRARCFLRLDGGERRQEAAAIVAELESGGHGRLNEVKQASAMLWLDERRQAIGSDLESAKAAATENPTDFGVVEAYAVSAFWAGKEVEAFEAGLALLRKKRSDEARQLVLSLVDALGPRHSKSKTARRSFNNALFV